jgi:hypothetical protein
LLRAGEIVAVPCSRQPFHPAVPGVLRAAALEAALEAGAPVLPVAVRGCELGLAWRVRVGASVRAPRGTTPTMLADRARAALAVLLSSP